jgi:hypothetical protein
MKDTVMAVLEDALYKITSWIATINVQKIRPLDILLMQKRVLKNGVRVISLMPDALMISNIMTTRHTNF